MSVNTSTTPDGRGVLIYNGEMILIYAKEVQLEFHHFSDSLFKGKKTGVLYLTSHRFIFTNNQFNNNGLQSFSMPFHSMRNVKLEQPVLAANFLKGQAISQQGGNWTGEMDWKLVFNKGGCIDFGMALLKAVDMAHTFRPYDSPPPYAPPSGGHMNPPPDYYTISNGNYHGFQAPNQAFPDHPPADQVFMYEEPPPYSGIGPDRVPYPIVPSSASSPAYPHAPALAPKM